MEKNHRTARGLVGRVLFLCALAFTAAAQAQPMLTWTAFNDHFAGPGTSNYTTAWNVFGTDDGAPGNSGPLRNIATGAALPVTLTIESSGNVGGGTTSGAPNQDTPAYRLFNGYIDWGNQNYPHAPQIYPGNEIDYTFTGLDPNKRYSFAGSSVRGGNGGDYARRWVLIELMDAASATPAHTAGTAIYTNGLPPTQAALNSGQNSATGDYTAWDNIDPGKDGTIVIRCAYYGGAIPGGTASGSYGYGLMAIRLQEFNVAPQPAAITVPPKNQTVLEGARATFSVVVAGNPPPAFQWYKNNTPIPYATNDVYAVVSAAASDNGATFYVVASNMVNTVSCLATSSVVKLTIQLDTTPPTLLNTLPAANTTVSALDFIEVFFSKSVAGVDAADLTINGSPAKIVNAITPSQYEFQFSQPPSGDVQFAWGTAHGITDTTVSSNGFAGGQWSVTLNTNIVYSIRINEFLASNKHINRDEDGDYSDWIELYNGNDITVPLAGCYLTDEPLSLTKWQFPPVSMTPNSYLLVWASGKNRTNSIAPLHTNFKLNNAGAYLALVAADGVSIISAFSPSYPEQQTDVSYGRDRTDPSLLGYFTSPTPKAPNATGGPGFAPEVVFSRDSCTFTASFTIRLSTASTNAVIRYTLGTNAPTASSTVYTGPIQIDNTVQIRARAFETGLLPGDIKSKDYVRLDTSTTELPRFSSTLPVLVFHNYGGGAVPVGENRGGYAQFSMIQVFEPKNGRSALTNAPDLAVQGTIHRRGQATLGNAKANLRVETLDEYGGVKNVSLLGLPSDNDWVLYGINVFDKVLMHNPLSHELYRQMGHYSSRTRFVEVFLKDDSGSPGPLTAGDYNGLYVLEEKIKIAKDRVDIDQLEPENTNAPSITGGYLFSVDKDGPAPGMSAANSYLWNLNPDGPTLNTPQWAPQRQYLANYLNTFYTTLQGANWTNPITGYAAYIDVPRFIDFHLHQVLVFNADMLRISTYYSKPRNGKLTPAALWDFDRAFGMTGSGDDRGFNPWRWRSASGDGGTDPFNSGNTFDNPWYRRLFTDPDFWQQWIDRYQELRRTVYSQSNLTAMIQHYGDEVAEATSREYSRWWDTRPNEGTVSGDGWSYTFPTPGTWAGQVQFIKVWFTNRLAFMDTNFLDRPLVNRSGGPVNAGTTFNLTPAGEAGSSVYYTLDGTDPRLAGGAISTKAFSSPKSVFITVTNNLRVYARSYNPNHRNLTGQNNPPISSPWSGVTAETYYTAIPSLRITEIMYHPGQPPKGNTNDADNFEYVELTNVGTDTLNLSGFRFTDGVQFTFAGTNMITSLPPGGRLLLVKNYAAFVSRYPNEANLVAGEFSGSLNNAGNRLVLMGSMGEPIHDFHYDNNWYPITDGLGFSLAAVDENAPLNTWTNQAQWRPSAFDGGSPGAADATPIVVQPVVINEILSHPIASADDAVELYNPNGTAVDIGFWYLTDNPTTPKKYLIPPGVIVPASGFVVFNKTNSFGEYGVTNALGWVNDDFGLSANDDAIYLFSGDSAGHLTGYYQGFDYGPAAPGVTFGRYTNSVGKIMHVAQSANTLGTNNAYPMVGPVVVSEIMYHPQDLIVDGLPAVNTRDEFIELHNRTGNPVPLFDTNHTANTWHIRDGVHFDLPSGVILPPYGYVLVVGFNPATDPVSLAGFQARYGLSNNISIYGPFEGQLDNVGERIDLRQPGNPDPNTGIAPMILVDRVDFAPTNPWPASANGAGASLQRQDNVVFGNDPANWIAAEPTPGWGATDVVPIDVAIELQSNTAMISWVNSPVSWTLEETADLTSPALWQSSTTQPQLVDGRWRIIAPVSASENKFFRLRKTGN